MFISLTGYARGSAREVNIADIQPNQFRNTHARGVEEFQHGAITQEVNLISGDCIAHELTCGGG
ncbi:hypothetical protein HMPREF2875_08960 [Corynebacterium sp. HMSC078H07]|nr:hypothetical protein HMPREF2875_08960 [Corynebacterium sp. HMSC078H07]